MVRGVGGERILRDFTDISTLPTPPSTILNARIRALIINESTAIDVGHAFVIDDRQKKKEKKKLDATHLGLGNLDYGCIQIGTYLYTR